MTGPPGREHVLQLVGIILRHTSGEGEEATDAAATTHSAQPTSVDAAVAEISLRSFHTAYKASTILNELPSYGPRLDPSLQITDDVSIEEADSLLSQEAERIRDCKDCWQFLRADFVCPVKDAKRADRNDPLDDGQASHSFDEGGDLVIDVVGATAWPVLGWLLTMFERDQYDTLHSGQGDWVLPSCISCVNLSTFYQQSSIHHACSRNYHLLGLSLE